MPNQLKQMMADELKRDLEQSPNLLVIGLLPMDAAGNFELRNKLRAKGVDKGLAEDVAAAARSTEVERARAVWLRKFRKAAESREERAKQMRFLQSRGFSFDAIRAVIQGADED